MSITDVTKLKQLDVTYHGTLAPDVATKFTGSESLGNNKLHAFEFLGAQVNGQPGAYIVIRSDTIRGAFEKVGTFVEDILKKGAA